MAVFQGIVTMEGMSDDAELSIGKEALAMKLSGRLVQLDYADIKDMRLLNYHVFLTTNIEKDVKVEISHLGMNTEEFFDKLWDAYDKRSQEALFLSGSPLMSCEGDYEYTEGAISRKSKAKLSVYQDSLCILPHDAGARRVPFCFCTAVVRDGFWLTLTLDTGESYRIGRLGRETEPFFEKVMSGQRKTLQTWQKAHAKLENDYTTRLGDLAERYEAMVSTGRKLKKGFFSLDEEEGFWCIALGGGKACMELFTKENTAAYVYSYQDALDEAFVAAVRHAMEAVGTHRELIFLEEESFLKNSLYRMAAERNRYVVFLRNALTGRIIHTGAWKEKI